MIQVLSELLSSCVFNSIQCMILGQATYYLCYYSCCYKEKQYNFQIEYKRLNYNLVSAFPIKTFCKFWVKLKVTNVTSVMFVRIYLENLEVCINWMTMPFIFDRQNLVSVIQSQLNSDTRAVRYFSWYLPQLRVRQLICKIRSETK